MNSMVALAAMFAASLPGGALPEIGLDLDHCASLSRQEVMRLVALELDARVSASIAADPQPTHVAVLCAGSSVQLTVSDRLTGKQLIRTMEVGAREENVAARLVTLAISELVITSWMELTLAHAPPRSPSGELPSAEAMRAAQERAERRAPANAAVGAGYVLVLAQATGPFAGIGLGWGGGLRLGWTSGKRWIDNQTLTGRPAADLELTGSRSDVENTLGTVHVSMWSAALRASIKLRRERAWLDLGGGGRFGLARLVGAPSDTSTRGRTLAATWAGPAGYAGVGIQWGRVIVAGGVEGGYVLRTVAGLTDGGPSVSVSGSWLSATLAMGWGQ